MIYYIYHIQSVKIGVTTRKNRRAKEQGYSNYEILETHTDIMKVSEREQELQKQYNLPIDKIPYWKSALCGMVGGKIGGRTQGNKNKKSGHLNIIQKLGREKCRKLTLHKSNYIKTQYARKVDIFGKKISQRRLAKLFSIDVMVVNRILSNKTYIIE